MKNTRNASFLNPRTRYCMLVFGRTVTPMKPDLEGLNPGIGAQNLTKC